MASKQRSLPGCLCEWLEKRGGRQCTALLLRCKNACAALAAARARVVAAALKAMKNRCITHKGMVMLSNRPPCAQVHDSAFEGCAREHAATRRPSAFHKDSGRRAIPHLNALNMRVTHAECMLAA